MLNLSYKKRSKNIYKTLLTISLIFLNTYEIYSYNNCLNLERVKSGIYGSLAPEFLSHLSNIFKVNNFLETGTCMGYTAQLASEYFSKVYTVELSEELYNEATKRLAYNNNIKTYVGDSSSVLINLLPEIKGRILFWLDGHYSGQNYCNLVSTAKGSEITAIVGEIDAIHKANINDAIILIDDIRLFEKTLSNNQEKREELEGYPELEIIVDKILDINKNYKFAVLNDMLLAYTPQDNITLSSLVQACTTSRLSNYFNNDITEIIKAEKIVGKSDDQEGIIIDQLYRGYAIDKDYKSYGFCKYYTLWYGLRQFYKGNYEIAFGVFNDAYQRGLTHWRLKYYMAKAANKAGYKSDAIKLLNEIDDKLKELVLD